MAWHHQRQQQQDQINSNMNMQNHPPPMNPNINPNQQQQFPIYPPYPINPSPTMYNQNYPTQSPYPPNPSPYNNTNTFQPYYGLQPMQSQQMISPFQQQPNINNLNNTQPLPQKFNFNSNTPNNMNMNMMAQTHPKQPELLQEEKYNNAIDNNIIDNEQPKSRLEYSKMSLTGPTELWVLNNKQKIDINNQLIEEEKIFGDIKIVYNEMKENNSVQMNGNTEKQNCRLLLQYKNDCIDDEKYTNNNKELQPLLVYDYNIRPYYEPFNEYNRYKLLRFPPISNYAMMNAAINITLSIYCVQFKDLPQFTVEDYLSQQIIFDHKIYTKCLENTKLFQNQIILLKSRIQNNKTNINTNIQLLDELITIRQKKDELQLEIKQLFNKIYVNWRNLVSWRYHEGRYKFSAPTTTTTTTTYQGTKLILYLKKIEPNRIAQQIEYKQALNDEISEIKNLIKYKNEIQKNEIIEFDEKIMKENIVHRQNTYLLSPGSVYYIAYIDTNSCNISATDLCNTTERFRRRQLTNYSIYSNIYVNNSQSKSTNITSTNKMYTEFPNFECNLQFKLEMKMLNAPQSIDIELKSNSWFFKSNKITNINIPIKTNTNTNLIKKEELFESEMNIKSNRYLTDEDYQTYISGINGNWNRQISGSISYGLQIDITDEYKSDEMVSVNVVSDQKQNENEELLLIDINEKNDGTFRQKMLKLRKRYAISRDECIPLFDCDISDSLYAIVHDDETKDAIAIRNEIILDRINNATIDVSEVICENKIDLFPCFSFSIYSLFKPGRKLRPTKNNYLLSKSSSINPAEQQTKCKIILQILQCRNLPIRQVTNIVQPFIEISFMGNKCRTFTSFGSNARWEQTLYIEFIPPGNHKYTPSNLQQINEDIEINIYDELITSIQNDDRKLNSHIQRKEKRYLGTIKIPFITIYFNQNIDGFFKLNIPLILLGYKKNIVNESTLLSLFITLDPPILNNNYKNNQNIYYEWILNNNNEENNDFYLYCIEWMKSIRKMNNNNGSRNDVEIFSSNSRNESNLISRYLRAIEPPMQVTPEIFVRFVSCIPYKEDIHLIPGARDIWMTNGDFLQIGCGDCEEHTNLLACYFLWYDNQNQNQNNGWSTYIAIGKSIPDCHNNMYVLRRNSILKHSGQISIQNVLLYDASNGISYNNHNNHNNNNNLCNLIDISIVYNEHQIYANLQSNDINPSSSLFSYQFENKEFWKPLFLNHQNFQSFQSSLQEPILNYKSLSNEYYIKRQNKLEYIIEKQFDCWRNLPTKWNYAICKILREILIKLEPLCQNGGYRPTNICNQDPQIFAIKQIYSKLYGFPLNIKDNGDQKLISEEKENNQAISLVYNTKVHENDDPNVEFARAVYIYPYTNKIASVWIYIASLSKQ